MKKGIDVFKFAFPPLFLAYVLAFVFTRVKTPLCLRVSLLYACAASKIQVQKLWYRLHP